jgi:hypothetical protein
VGVIAAKLAEFTHGDGGEEQAPAVARVVRGLRAGSVRTELSAVSLGLGPTAVRLFFFFLRNAVRLMGRTGLMTGV